MKLFSRRQPEVPERRRRARSEQAASGASESLYSAAFRRGRTLTGSVSSVIRSSNEAQADLKSPRVHAHMLAKQRRRLGGVFVLALLAAIGLYVLTSQFTARVVIQASPDPSHQLESVYAESIESYLVEHPIERWRMLLNTERLKLFLRGVVPEVKEVKVNGSAGFGASLFTLTFREPIASWDVGGNHLYVDEAGVPFGRNYFSSPSLLITDRSGVPTTPGQTIASNRFMGFVGQVIGYSKERGYTVSGITIPPGMTRQIEVQVEGVEYPIKFSSDRPAGESVEDMVRTIEWMRTHQQSPEYIDVRVQGRAFYRVQ